MKVIGANRAKRNAFGAFEVHQGAKTASMCIREAFTGESTFTPPSHKSLKINKLQVESPRILTIASLGFHAFIGRIGGAWQMALEKLCRAYSLYAVKLLPNNPLGILQKPYTVFSESPRLFG